MFERYSNVTAKHSHSAKLKSCVKWLNCGGQNYGQIIGANWENAYSLQTNVDWTDFRLLPYMNA